MFCGVKTNMQRFTMKLFFLFSTFFVGVAAFYIFYLPLTSDDKPNSNVEPSNVASVQIPDKQKIDEFYAVSPCKGENQYKYRLKWKAKGTISVGVVNSRALCGVLPELSQSEGNIISGIKTVEVLIDETGEVFDAQAKSEYSVVLQKALTDAARQTKFEPYMLRGDSHKARGIIMYNFDGKGRVQLYKFSR